MSVDQRWTEGQGVAQTSGGGTALAQGGARGADHEQGRATVRKDDAGVFLLVGDVALLPAFKGSCQGVEVTLAGRRQGVVIAGRHQLLRVTAQRTNGMAGWVRHPQELSGACGEGGGGDTRV